MNKLERFIYDKVKNNPTLKNRLVDIYQRLLAVIPIKKVVSDYNITVRKGYFFGFHDKCPWSYDNQFLLAHQFSQAPFRMPLPDEEIEIGYFYGENFRKFKEIAKTKSWNWQQGAMLQWVGNSHNIIFNDFDGERNIARIVDLEGNVLSNLPKAIAAISPEGKKALSYSFERLKKGAPAYTYANGKELEENVPIPQKDGLYIMDIESKNIEKLFSIANIVKIQPDSSMDNAYHYFSHCLFSPSGNRFVFYHRWLMQNGLLKTRMISCDLSGEDIFIFPTNGMVSHISWRDDKHILAYARTDKLGDKYYLFEDKTGNFSIIGDGKLTSDGHPQYSNDKRYILTDTYPDKFRKQYLIIYDTEHKEIKKIAILKIPLKYRYDLRCDFHPRWNRDSTMLCFDSAHMGKRSLCTIKLR